MKTTAILVDDEENALESLALKINRFFPDISIIGKFQNPKEAIIFINKNNPDILFLDVEMPVLTGFDVLTKLTKPNFEIIFVTAYSNYAIEAFKHAAMGYVVKPIDNEELKTTVKNAIKNSTQKNAFTKNKALLDKLINSSTSGKISIPTSKGISFINKSDILNFEGYDGYTKIHLTNNSEIMSSYNIGKFEKMLCNMFYKCHKSHIINLQKINAFENEGYVVLENKKRIPISKIKRKEFIEFTTKNWIKK